MDNREIALAADMASSEGGGTTDYTDLSNKPQINGNQLVGNKTAADLGLVATADIDSSPTQGSGDPVASGGVYTALDGKQDTIDTTHKLDADLVDDSTSGHKFAWSGTQAAYAQAAANIAEGELVAFTDDTDIDTVPTQGSDNPVTSGGVYNALARLDTTTGDIYFGQTRVARLMDYDSYAALSTKENIYYLTYPTPSQNSGHSLQASTLIENENEGIRTEPEEPAPDESEMR